MTGQAEDRENSGCKIICPGVSLDCTLSTLYGPRGVGVDKVYCSEVISVPRYNV